MRLAEAVHEPGARLPRAALRATDAAGNLDQSHAGYSWTVDLVAPETSIASRPPDVVTNGSASFGLSANESGVAYECSLDDGAYAACTSPAEYSGLGNGDHTFRVRATDAVGNVDQSPAAASWTVDLPPDTEILDGPDNPTASPNATFTVSSGDPGVTYECSLDGSSFSQCPTPIEYTGLPSGDHVLEVRAKDGAGSVDSEPGPLRVDDPARARHDDRLGRAGHGCRTS